MDARVKTTADAMNVLRMIKLFGWETQVNKDIDFKRTEELRLLWYRSLLNLSNKIVKQVFSSFRFLIRYILIRLLSFIIPLVYIILTFTIYVSA